MITAPANKLRVVFDTNVYFSAFTHRGLPFWIWQQAVLRRFILLLSPPLLRDDLLSLFFAQDIAHVDGG